jgi:membrane protease YdiL (CAAX protease family)
LAAAKAILNPIALLLHDTVRLFKGRDAKVSALLLAALLLQSAYWHLGSPGPALLWGAPRDLATAMTNIGWSVLLFFAVPLLLLRLLNIPFREAGLRLGDAAFGLKATLVMSALAAAVMYVSAQNPALQAVYPWAGAWPGRSVAALVAWAGLYALYYLSYEFFFRGFMIRAVEPYWGLTAAVWVQALCSALIHLGKPLPEVVAALPFALLFAVFAVRTRSIFWPALFHLAIGFSTDVFSLLHQGLLLP